MKDTPAEKAGLRADDHITHIEGFPTEAMSTPASVRFAPGLEA